MDEGRLFGLDLQLLFDAFVMFIFIMLLYVIMSNLFFKPVRAFLEKRQEGIDKDHETAKADEEKALQLKAVYEDKLKHVNKEAENLLSISRRQALQRQEEIIADAKAKAMDVLSRVREDVLAEKRQVRDDVKHQMAEIAGLMASEFVESTDVFRQELLVENALKEMGGDAWHS